ncbi:9054_t:CDS:2 [Entrophospora sp. SA101]|nr:9054_t:CDS:2 [Entrophospora sp. SA101]CAJ0829070.1 14928_t:CDS:2 [Entrophospora sp. SA101]
MNKFSLWKVTLFRKISEWYVVIFIVTDQGLYNYTKAIKEIEEIETKNIDVFGVFDKDIVKNVLGNDNNNNQDDNGDGTFSFEKLLKHSFENFDDFEDFISLMNQLPPRNILFKYNGNDSL